MTLRMQANPYIGVSRGNRQSGYSRELRLVGDCFLIRADITKAATTTYSPNSGITVRHVYQSRGRSLCRKCLNPECARSFSLLLETHGSINSALVAILNLDSCRVAMAI